MACPFSIRLGCCRDPIARCCSPTGAHEIKIEQLGKDDDTRPGNRHPTIVSYETFEASGGEFVLAVGNDDPWRCFCTVAGLDHHQRFATNRSRLTRYDELEPILVERLRREARQYWIDRLTAIGVPCGSVRELHEVLSDP